MKTKPDVNSICDQIKAEKKRILQRIHSDKSPFEEQAFDYSRHHGMLDALNWILVRVLK